MKIKFVTPRLLLIIGFIFLTIACNTKNKDSDYIINKKVDSVISLMTLEEKIGQLNCLQGQYNTSAYNTSYNLDDEIKQGKVGSLTSGGDMDLKIKWQTIAVTESRLKIPLLFNTDVIHGYRTIFPVPIGQAASWDLKAIELAERISSTEASAAGIHWTFAPMVDIARDPRWGRVMEGAGEDPYLGSKIAAARIRGIQGNLGDSGTLMACVKHYAAYGAAEGGREYNTVDMSELVLRQEYLPPYKAAIDAGAATIMNSFNVFNRMPASSNELLVKQILKNEWNFKGFTVSDAFSFYELIPHGVTSDSMEAAKMCINAQSDVDLWARIYSDWLPKLIKDGKVKEKQIDVAVKRVLYYKFKIGLFNDPFKCLNKEKLSKALLKPEYLEREREIARKTFVLLKNKNQLLPLKKDIKTIAVIGWTGVSRENNNYIGTWSADAKKKDIVTLSDGVKQVASPKTKILIAQGCNAYGICNDKLTKEAVNTAKNADVVILALGEDGTMSGECSSRAYIGLPNQQEELVKAIYATGKPIVAVIFAGRPLTFQWTNENIPAILYVWQPGTMGGLAIADVLFGDYNPSGKLPMTFPITLGQVPIYYNCLNTGRPRLGNSDHRWGVSKWSDVSNDPMYPFGFGLSYTTFKYSNLKLNTNQMSLHDTLLISVDVKNIGKYDGEEVVQLYIQDEIGSVSRPLKELKGFEKIIIKKGDSKNIVFYITIEDLKFWTKDMKFDCEHGKFNVFVGTNSVDVINDSFVLK